MKTSRARRDRARCQERAPAAQHPSLPARSMKLVALTSNACSAGAIAPPVRAVLGRTGDEGGAQAAGRRRDQIAAMRRDHHAGRGRQIEQGSRAQIGLRLRLVGARHLGAEDHVPGQPGALGHVDHQRDVAVGERREDEPALQPAQAFDRVRPRVEPVPGAIEVIDLGLAQPADRMLVEQRQQVLAVQVVEPGPGAPAAPDLLQRRLIARPPGIGEGMPVARDPPRTERRSGLARDALAPVHDRAEHVEAQRLDVRKAHRLSSRNRRPQARTRAGSAPARRSDFQTTTAMLSGPVRRPRGDRGASRREHGGCALSSPQHRCSRSFAPTRSGESQQSRGPRVRSAISAPAASAVAFPRRLEFVDRRGRGGAVPAVGTRRRRVVGRAGRLRDLRRSCARSDPHRVGWARLRRGACGRCDAAPSSTRLRARPFVAHRGNPGSPEKAACSRAASPPIVYTMVGIFPDDSGSAGSAWRA